MSLEFCPKHLKTTNKANAMLVWVCVRFSFPSCFRKIIRFESSNKNKLNLKFTTSLFSKVWNWQETQPFQSFSFLVKAFIVVLVRCWYVLRNMQKHNVWHSFQNRLCSKTMFGTINQRRRRKNIKITVGVTAENGESQIPPAWSFMILF